jgi:hypothetical protein
LKREEEKAVTGKGKEVTKAVGEVLAADGRSFKEVLSEVPGGEKRVLAPVVQRKAGAELGVVVMEVEPEAEALKKLNGAYVGFLSEFMHHQTLQRDFVMDGYHNIVVTPLSHLKVLLSSSVVGEVHDLVGSVGWWCNCFEKFEAWSPNCVSNRRVTWLYCFGVPLHVWGDAIFRSLGFKFGTFIETDEDTKQMRRGDVAKVRIETELPGVVDASILISVMGQNFSIRVIEQVGGTGVEGLKFGGEGAKAMEELSCVGSGDGGSLVAVAVGESEGGGESDWSEGRHELLDVACQQDRKGVGEVLRLVGVQEMEQSVNAPTLLGNVLGVEPDRVNIPNASRELMLTNPCGALVVVPDVSDRSLEGVELGDGHVSREGDGVKGLGGKERGGVQQLEERCSVQPVGTGPTHFRPKFLRTKGGDLPVGGVVNIVVEPGCDVNSGAILADGLLHSAQNPDGGFPVSDSELICQARGKSGRTKKASKKTLPLPPGHKFANFQEMCNGARKSRRAKPVKCAAHRPNYCSDDSDPIESGGVETLVTQYQHFSDPDGIGLEVVLSRPVAEGDCSASSVVPCSVVDGRGRNSSGLEDLLAAPNQLDSNVMVTGGVVDKERGDAFHVIDIQEDIGMTFKGEGEEDVVRCMKYEGRDRQKKIDWVQGNGF